MKKETKTRLINLKEERLKYTSKNLYLQWVTHKSILHYYIDGELYKYNGEGEFELVKEK